MLRNVKKQKPHLRAKKAKNCEKLSLKNPNLFRAKDWQNSANLQVGFIWTTRCISKTIFSLKRLLLLAQRLEEIKKIREAISRASSLEEVERLNQLLMAGTIPGMDKSHSGNVFCPRISGIVIY